MCLRSAIDFTKSTITIFASMFSFEKRGTVDRKSFAPNLMADLVERGLVRPGRLVKVLGAGEVGVKLEISADAFSATARQRIEAAGGSATEF